VMDLLFQGPPDDQPEDLNHVFPSHPVNPGIENCMGKNEEHLPIMF
jgi:hypothetical protein